MEDLIERGLLGSGGRGWSGRALGCDDLEGIGSGGLAIDTHIDGPDAVRKPVG